MPDDPKDNPGEVNLRAVHDSVDEIPEPFRPLYTEKGGKWEISGIQGVKTEADVARVTTALDKEREEHKKTKERYRGWNDFSQKPEEIQAVLDEVDELRARVANAGKLDDEKIDQISAARIKAVMGPVEREKGKLEETVREQATRIAEFEANERRRTIHDALSEALGAPANKGFRTSARADALLLAERVFEVDENGKVVTRDNVGVTPGIDPSIWLVEMQSTREHWWEESKGGGAPGSRKVPGFTGKNPWSRDAWNMTAQGRYIMEHGEDKAKQLAESAGSFIGAVYPPAASKN